ncbi:MAG: hypothetical protein L7H00_02660 [Vulcanisaeta sp.]|nr:hypothetical protein [Vulcanisaeta sp.]MCG2892413.1 hypothetical protein [Vulcanisaeta sp.]MCG2894793.1 hypothetical protein [Vulcanisaeta sp.]
MFGRKKKVDLEELLQELAGSDDEEGGRARLRKRVDVDNDEGVAMGSIRFKVEFEGVDELVKEIRALRESINELIDLLKEQGPASVKK